MDLMHIIAVAIIIVAGIVIYQKKKQ